MGGGCVGQAARHWGILKSTLPRLQTDCIIPRANITFTCLVYLLVQLFYMEQFILISQAD